MWFQDLFNFDLRSIEASTTVVATQEGEIPFCAYNSAGWREAVERMHSSAMSWVIAEVAAREQHLQARNDETLTAQAESLQMSLDRRRLRLRELIEESHAPSITRMRIGQLDRLETDAEAKLARLEAKRGVSLGYRLVALGLVVASDQ